ncbi:MAG: twin-arginine translocase subunit TatC [Alphaproteobacteria bacterium]|nr:twin-arginine translocase subunit TatC [Alphaproteobacteria bacterium]
MKKMTMMEHFSELRRRLLFVVGIFMVTFLGGWFVAPWVQKFLVTPLLSVWDDPQLIYTGLTDGLMIRVSLSLLVAWLITIPVALWQVWAFVSPGLHQNERRFVIPIFILSPLLFITGAAFAFYVLFPTVFGFFIELNETSPVPALVMPDVRNYISFSIGMLKIFGIAFQLPLVLVLLNRLGFLSRERMKKMRRYAIVIIAVVAAILTPPDIVSQILLGLPMWALFEISILFMKK